MRIPIISDLFGYLFKFLYDISQNQYLLTLFLFALIMKLVLLPLGIKQQKNSIKQARLRPKEMAIRNKYKGRTDKITQQKMSEEIMTLYQEENVNPMSGCLPLLIQMPILFALYDVIRNPLTYILKYSSDVVNQLATAVEIDALDQIKLINKLVNFGGSINVEGAKLSEIVELKESFNFFGLDLSVVPSEKWGIYVLIPVLTFVFSFFSTKLIRKFTYQPQMAADDASRASLTMMDWMMPLMSVWISVILSSALGIYWMFQNILSVLQQMLLYKLYPVPVVTPEQIKEAELQLKGKSKKTAKAPVLSNDYYDDYDKTEKKPEKKKQNPENMISTRKVGISPKVRGKKLKARRKI